MTGVLLACAILGQGPAAASTPMESAGQPQDSFHIFLRHYDRDRNGVLSAEEVPSELIAVFAKTDLNQDGVLDAGELLTAKTKIGRSARKAEGVKLTLFGKLKTRTGNAEAGDPQLRQTLNLVNQLDGNRDGRLGPSEIAQPIPTMAPEMTAPETASPAPSAEFAPLPSPAVDLGLARRSPAEPSAPSQPAATPDATAPVEQGRTPAVAALNPPPSSQLQALAPQPTLQTTPQPAPQPAPRKPKKDSDGYPEPEEIIENLDRNGNGMVDRDEAVDQLADRFGSIDKDGNGALDLQELQRALRLARLFGIKPKVDPNQYRK